MEFTATLTTSGPTAYIELAGDLDATTAPRFREKIEQAATADLERLVLEMAELNYMSSAGLRSLVFARQKMGRDVEIVLVSPVASVLETIKLTGFDHSVTFSERVT